ncbi:MAG: hypothetical protein AABW67_01990 [Nanoarchaeota archaeon]
MNRELKQKIKEVDLSYQKREQKQTEIWAGFDKELQELTGIVSQEFNRVLNETDLSVIRNNIKRKVKINSFQVDYTPQPYASQLYSQPIGFVIEIKNWSVDIDGKSHSDREGNYQYCAHDYLEKIIGFDNKIDPKITEFKKDFSIGYIGYNCGCGSDHK